MCGETKLARLSRSHSKGREREALQYYWNSLAFPRAREVCFADVRCDARGSRTYCAYQSASRVSYEPENAGESYDERFPPFWNRANAHEASFSPRLASRRAAPRRLPGVDLPQGMDGVVRDAILEPLRVGTRTVTWKVTYLVVNKDVCSIPYPTASEIALRI